MSGHPRGRGSDSSSEPHGAGQPSTRRLASASGGPGPAVDVVKKRRRVTPPGLPKPPPPPPETLPPNSSSLGVADEARSLPKAVFLPPPPAAAAAPSAHLAVDRLGVQSLQPRGPHAQLHGPTVEAKLGAASPGSPGSLGRAVVLRDDAVPKLGVVLGDLVLEVGDVERVEKRGAGRRVARGRRGSSEPRGVDDLCPGKDGVDVLFHELLLPRLARSVVLLEDLLGAEAQDRGHLVLGELLGVGRGLGASQDRLCRRGVVSVGSTGSLVGIRGLTRAAPSRGVHALDDEVVEDHLPLGALEDVLLLLIGWLRGRKRGKGREREKKS